jgi:hypothetical protein
MTWFGRALELNDGTIVLPCEYCGTPAFRPETHTCAPSTAALLAEMEDRDVV